MEHVDAAPAQTLSASWSASRRRFFAPEVIQTSAMDCGPAALKCLLDGFGIGVGYGRLREACQTSVDGTSIDTLESLAQTLGLDAEQVMMPVDHLLLPESEALPAIVVLRLPSGLTHFVVVWRAHGGWVQVMDPARGRRWVRRETFLRDVFVHSLPLPAAAFREWAESEAFTGALARRMRALGVDGDAAAGAIARALAEPGWRAVAALDGAVRAAAALAAAGAVRARGEAGRLALALAADESATPPAAYVTATAAPAADDGTEQVMLRGAVLVRVGGAAALDEERRAALPVELRAAVEERRPRVAAELVRLARDEGAWRWAALAGGIALAAAGAVAEGVLFRTLIDAGARVLPALLAVLAALLALELPMARGLRRLGGGIEERLRRRFLYKIPRLPDRYFQSRPMSDMAERAHLLHRLRGLPTLAGEALRALLQILALAVGLVWLYPPGAPFALALAVAVVAVPLIVQAPLAERDLRMRNHAGALSRFYLDALLGLTAARTHRGEAALVREHRDRLAEWVRAARESLAAAVSAEAVQAVIGFGLAAGLLASFFARRGAGAAPAVDQGTALLVVYWALSLPVLGRDFAAQLQQIPGQRNLALRLIEPLGAPEEPAAAGPAPEPTASSRGVAIALDAVRVVAAGQEILDVPALAIASGEQIAIVGASGAGKSSLLGLLLGWHRAAAGTVLVDGAPFDRGALEALRRRTVWVDPSVYLWNRSLRQNLAFGLASTPEELARSLDDALAGADLSELAARLPNGIDTPLGEAGGLVSGGEGQRVRFGRGLVRAAPTLVVLDEPFRGLSRDQRGGLLARARQRWAGATLLCVTHDIEETASFPRVLVIAGGRIVEDDAPAALLARAGSRYATLLEAERRVRTGAWQGAAWRRLRLRDGRIVEDGA